MLRDGAVAAEKDGCHFAKDSFQRNGGHGKDGRTSHNFTKGTGEFLVAGWVWCAEVKSTLSVFVSMRKRIAPTSSSM